MPHKEQGDGMPDIERSHNAGRFALHQWHYAAADGTAPSLTHDHPLNAVIDNGRCNLGHEWDEGFNPECALCMAVRDAMDVLIRSEAERDA